MFCSDSVFGHGWQTEKESYIKKLDVESERVSQLRQQMCSEDAKEQEIHNVHQQVTDLQVLTNR